MLNYERKQLNDLIDDKYTLVGMLRNTIDSACGVIENFVKEEKQKDAMKYFIKNMIKPIKSEMEE